MAVVGLEAALDVETELGCGPEVSLVAEIGGHFSPLHMTGTRSFAHNTRSKSGFRSAAHRYMLCTLATYMPSILLLPSPVQTR